MVTTEVAPLALALTLALSWGVLLGVLFFGGLWWTLRKSLASIRPALWVMGSLLLRSGIVLAGFYLVGNGQWQRLLACLAGFILARLIVTRLTGTAGKSTTLAQEASHAPES